MKKIKAVKVIIRFIFRTLIKPSGTIFVIGGKRVNRVAYIIDVLKTIKKGW